LGMDLNVGGTQLVGMRRINVILGKNGCGKSSLLRRIQDVIRDMPNWGDPKYVTPERGGVLAYEQGIENNARSNPQWYRSVLERNQFAQYKQQTVYQFDRLQLAVLQAIASAVEAGQTPPRRTYVDDVNSLLDNVEIRENSGGDKSFKIFQRGTDQEIKAEHLSSGESELISLGIECLAFSLGIDETKLNMLILDEPDVHLHPDLQARLTRFLCDIVIRHPSITVVLATHSTAILGELTRHEYSAVCPMVRGQAELVFDGVDSAYKRILPVFGAHPLSSVFRDEPLLLVEGADEWRIWQQALRTSEGRVHFYPVDTNGLGDMPAFEDRAVKVAAAVYDNAIFYSLRDRDEGDYGTIDAPPLIRLKLACRASENLLLSDDVLAHFGIEWVALQRSISEWIELNHRHPRHEAMRLFAEDGFQRMTFDLKPIRLLLVDLMGSNKPWEVVVGQALGMLTPSSLRNPSSGSMAEFLGEKLALIVAGMLESSH